jgi:UDP-N-acetyl-D-glucosamine dehydrogenase
VLAGLDAASLAAAEAVYGLVSPKLTPVSSLETAEATKITENVFRAVNIALVNELKGVYAAMGVDVFEVVDAAATKPFGYMPFYPGPGLGGHCIPIDPFYLAWRAEALGLPTRFVELAGEINATQPAGVITALAEALSQKSRLALNGARVLVLGVAYKKNVNDIRESPGLEILDLLQSRGAETAYHDPFGPEIGMTRRHPTLAGVRQHRLMIYRISTPPWSSLTTQTSTTAALLTPSPSSSIRVASIANGRIYCRKLHAPNQIVPSQTV